MKTLLDPARQVARDLVAKKLWPVAALLVVAIVGMPLVIGSGSEVVPAQPADPAKAVPEAQAFVTAVEAPARNGSRGGRLRDPIFDPPDLDSTAAAAVAAGAPATAPGDAGAAGAPAAGGPAAGGAPVPPTSKGETTTAKPSNRLDTTKSIDATFGRSGAPKRNRRLRPGTDLPSSSGGVIRYVGVVAHTRLARFVAVNDRLGQTTGDAKCYEKENRCYALDMKAGDRQAFVVDGVRYELRVNSVPLAGKGDTDTQDAAETHSYLRTLASLDADGGKAATARALARLTPLPSASAPVALFLGVSERGATFALAPGAIASGDGACLDGACRVIALEPKGKASIVAGGRTHTLHVRDVEKVPASEQKAREQRSSEHPEGRDVLRALIRNDRSAAAAIGAIRYDRGEGVLELTAGTAVKKLSR